LSQKKVNEKVNKKEQDNVIEIEINEKKNYKFKNFKNDEENEELSFIYRQTKLFELIKSGKDSNLKKIGDLISKDPNKYLYDSSKKELFFINKKNFEFITPLYVATLNGHLNVVKILIENGADHLGKIGKDSEGEFVLQTSIRWKLSKIIEFYLDLEWPKKIP